jgi:hypothetical protein
VDEQALDQHASQLAKVWGLLAPYATGLAEVDPADQHLVEQAEAARTLMEQIYRQHITFTGEGLRRYGLPATVGGRAVLDVLNDDRMLCFVDPVQHAPLSTEPGAVKAGQPVPERFTDPVRRLQERSGNEVNSRGGYVLREQLRDRAPGRAGHTKLVRPRAHHLRSARSARAASAP